MNMFGFGTVGQIRHNIRRCYLELGKLMIDENSHINRETIVSCSKFVSSFPPRDFLSHILMVQFVKSCAFVSANTDMRRGNEEPIWHLSLQPCPTCCISISRWSDGLVFRTLSSFASLLTTLLSTGQRLRALKERFGCVLCRFFDARWCGCYANALQIRCRNEM